MDFGGAAKSSVPPARRWPCLSLGGFTEKWGWLLLLGVVADAFLTPAKSHGRAFTTFYWRKWLSHPVYETKRTNANRLIRFDSVRVAFVRLVHRVGQPSCRTRGELHAVKKSCAFDFFFFLILRWSGKIKLKLPHMTSIKRTSCVNLTRRSRCNSSSCCCYRARGHVNPDLIPRDPLRWRWPPGDALVSG